jgi:hypothetical protein
MNIIEQLQETKRQTLVYFAMEGEGLHSSYAPGKWTVKELLHHLADAETVLYDRVKRVISEPRQVIWAFDQDAWSLGLNYKKMPLHLSKEVYRSVREAVVYLANEYYESLGQNSFVHSESGIRTLKDEFDKIAWHNAHHLKQIEMALSNGSK